MVSFQYRFPAETFHCLKEIIGENNVYCHSGCISSPGKKIKEEYCAKKCFLSLVSERDSKMMTGCLNFSKFEEFAVCYFLYTMHSTAYGLHGT